MLISSLSDGTSGACGGTTGPLPAAQAYNEGRQWRLWVTSPIAFMAGVWGVEKRCLPL